MGLLSHIMENIKHTLAKAVSKVLQPLIRVLLRFEISHSEFSELSKRTYIDVANAHFSLPNKANTYSRNAVITGLSRKEVVRLSQCKQEDIPETKGPLNRANRVISGWMRDNQFLDKNNKPKDLPMKGESGSFDQLVSLYSGDITARTILDELIRVGTVEKLDKHTVRLTGQAYIPQKSENAMIEMIAKHANDLMSTGIHNLENENEPARFQRQVTYKDIPEDIAEEFREFSAEKSMQLLREFDQWLAEKKSSQKTDSEQKKSRVGVGIYYFKNENDEG